MQNNGKPSTADYYIITLLMISQHCVMCVTFHDSSINICFTSSINLSFGRIEIPLNWVSNVPP